MNEILTIDGYEFHCNFDTTEIQDELDGIIVASKLLGFEVEIEKYRGTMVINIFKKESSIDICYIELFFKQNSLTSKPIHLSFIFAYVQQYASRRQTCVSGKELLDAINEIKNLIAEAA